VNVLINFKYEIKDVKIFDTKIFIDLNINIITVFYLKYLNNAILYLLYDCYLFYFISYT